MQIEWWQTFVSSFAGGGVTALTVVWGLSGHLGKRWIESHKNELRKELQDYKDVLERRRQKIEADLGHRTYVSRTQFTTEFKALKDIFRILGKLSLAFNALFPELRIERLNATKQEQRDEFTPKFQEFVDYYNDTVTLTQTVLPFVPENLFQAFDECTRAAGLAILDIQTSGDIMFTAEWYKQGRERRDKFRTAYHEAATQARKRFQELAVVND